MREGDTDRVAHLEVKEIGHHQPPAHTGGDSAMGNPLVFTFWRL